MPQFKNIHDKPIVFSPDGPGSAKTIASGAIFELSEEQAYLVGTQISKEHVEVLPPPPVEEAPPPPPEDDKKGKK